MVSMFICPKLHEEVRDNAGVDWRERGGGRQINLDQPVKLDKRAAIHKELYVFMFTIRRNVPGPAVCKNASKRVHKHDCMP